MQKAVEQVIGQFPTYGSRGAAHKLRREHGEFKAIGRKRVYRVLGEMGLKLRRKAIKKQTTDSRHSFPRYENLVVAALEQRNVQISMAAVGHAEENGYTERVIRTIKEEEVALNEYPDLISAKLRIGRFIDKVYCAKRIHSSLGYLTPAEWSERSL